MRLKWAFRGNPVRQGKNQTPNALSKWPNLHMWGQFYTLFFGQARKRSNDSGNGYDFRCYNHFRTQFLHNFPAADDVTIENKLVTEILRENELSKTPRGTRAVTLVPNELAEKVRTTELRTQSVTNSHIMLKKLKRCF